MKLILSFLMSLLCQSCMYSVHQYHMGDFANLSKSSGKPIVAEGERTVVMSFSTDTSYVENAYDQLQSKCPKGKIVGIATKHSTDLLFFHQIDRLSLQALCLQ